MAAPAKSCNRAKNFDPWTWKWYLVVSEISSPQAITGLPTPNSQTGQSGCVCRYLIICNGPDCVRIHKTINDKTQQWCSRLTDVVCSSDDCQEHGRLLLPLQLGAGVNTWLFSFLKTITINIHYSENNGVAFSPMDICFHHQPPSRPT